ncbi:MAG: D-alanine--D-alanine ligase [Candidatus Omnitrophica bacterium]|nr:D-alanine--D-alanine ligase [Candidatus Omnitrophota bacterium]
MDVNNVGRIGVLMGGPSSEREISLKSGKAVQEALRGVGINVVGIDIKTDNVKENMRLIQYYGINCAFIALHGKFGEDGTIQKILEDLEIPYTGSGVEASKLAMDKIASLRLFEEAGLAVPAYEILEKNSNWSFSGNIKFPLVVKPATHGSSIGLSIIDKNSALAEALNLAFSFDDRVIIQEYIRGREMTVGILDGQALPVIEIVPKKRFFDYEAKYQSGMTEYIVPARLEDSIAKKIQESAINAHRLLGCSGCSRADIILNELNIPFILEVNTIPGLTATSLLPKAAKAVGIEFVQLCLKLIALAYEKNKSKPKLKTKRLIN